MVCLDTNVVVAYLKGDENIIKKMKENNIDLSKLSVTAITIYELLCYPSRKREAQVYEFISNVTTYDFDTNASIEAAKIQRELAASGKIIDPPDIMIAATAISKNETLVTKDLAFENIGSKNIIVIKP